jgi:type I restriction enzyme, S subunit
MANDTGAVHLTQTGGRPATKGVIPGRYALSVGLPKKPAPVGWKWTALSDVARLESGHTPSRRFSEYWDGDIPWIGIKDATDNHGRVIFDTYQHVTQEGIDNSSARMLPAGTVCLSRTASVGFVVVMGRPMATSQDFVNWICSDKMDNHFLKYVLLSEHDSMLRFASGTTHQTIYYPEAKAFHVCLPDIQEQREIAGILGALDDKIELNRRMNRTLESMAREVFRQWFVENEEVAEWKIGKLGNVMTNFDAKRVPVPNMERAQRQGKYPYYGAASVMDYIDDYLFDGIYVLMGEDGSVVGSAGHPIIQYVWGKIWVNNHAHVLQGVDGICNEHLYLFLKDVNILPYVTGAVQPKINQANMNSIPFPLPPMELRKKFEEFVSPLFAKIRANDEESRTLASLRDTLLPKLMRGEVRVKDVEKEL